MIRVGDVAVHEFTVTADTMEAFQRLSGDVSRVHCDPAYARERGFNDIIVYGGIMLAQLSYMVGMKLPGPQGTSTKWTINYREPLYLNETARLALQIIYVSKSTGIVEGKFQIATGERTIASGTTQSIVPSAEIDEA